MKCPSCQRSNVPTNRFCIFCGSPIPAPETEEPAQAEEKRTDESQEKISKPTKQVMSDFWKALGATAFPVVALSLVTIFGVNIFREFLYVGLAAAGLWVILVVAAIVFNDRGEKRIVSGMSVGIGLGIISLGAIGLVILEIAFSGY